MSERTGRAIENLLALMGGLVLVLAVTVESARELGFALGACAAAENGIPWSKLIVGVVLVMPKTISRGTASDFVGAVSKRLGGLTGTAVKAVKRGPDA